MSVSMFLKTNKVLWPLLGCVGAGVGGGLLFAGHYLSNNQDVVVNKKTRDPWNKVGQSQNTKMFSYNPDFWKGRIGMADPRMAFMQEIENKDPSKRTQAEQSFLRRVREQNQGQAQEARQ